MLPSAKAVTACTLKEMRKDAVSQKLLVITESTSVRDAVNDSSYGLVLLIYF
jgi:hypothetical protein